MVLMFVRQQNGVDMADACAEHLAAEIGAGVDDHPHAARLDHGRGAQASVAPVRRGADLAAASDDRDAREVPVPRKVSFMVTKIRISREKEARLHFFRGEYLRRSQNTNKREQKQVYLHFAEREYLRHSQSANKPREKASSLAFFPPQCAPARCPDASGGRVRIALSIGISRAIPICFRSCGFITFQVIVDEPAAPWLWRCRGKSC